METKFQLPTMPHFVEPYFNEIEIQLQKELYALFLGVAKDCVLYTLPNGWNVEVSKNRIFISFKYEKKVRRLVKVYYKNRIEIFTKIVLDVSLEFPNIVLDLLKEVIKHNEQAREYLEIAEKEAFYGSLNKEQEIRIGSGLMQQISPE